MIKNNDTVNILIGLAGLVGIGYAIGTHTKLAKVGDRLDRGIDELAKDMEFDIPKELVNKAIDKAVEAEAERAVAKATNEAISSLKRDIHTQVQDALNTEYDNLKDSVLKEITEKAAKIDVSRVRRDVEKAAKEAAIKKFDDNLDDILEKFNTDLDNTGRIYSSIREAMTRSANSDKQFVVRLA